MRLLPYFKRLYRRHMTGILPRDMVIVNPAAVHKRLPEVRRRGEPGSVNDIFGPPVEPFRRTAGPRTARLDRPMFGAVLAAYRIGPVSPGRSSRSCGAEPIRELFTVIGEHPGYSERCLSDEILRENAC